MSSASTRRTRPSRGKTGWLVAAALLLGPGPLLAQDTVFDDAFEGGDTCAWSSDGGRCTVDWSLSGGPTTYGVATTARGRFFVERLPGVALPGQDPGLFRLDDQLSPTGPSLCTLRDNGDVAAGDDTSEDGRYSCFANFDTTSAAEYRIGAVLAGTRVSPFLRLHIVAPLTTAEYNTVLNVQTGAQQIMEDALAAHGDTPAARTATAAALAVQPGVAGVSISADGDVVWIDYASGVEGAALFIDTSAFETEGPLADELRALAPPLRGSGPAPLRGRTSRAGESEHVIGNNRVVLWAPWVTSVSLQNLHFVLGSFTHPETCPPFEVAGYAFGAADLESVDLFPVAGTLVLSTVLVTARDFSRSFLLTGQPITSVLNAIELLGIAARTFVPITLPERGAYWSVDTNYPIGPFPDSMTFILAYYGSSLGLRRKSGQLAFAYETFLQHDDLEGQKVAVAIDQMVRFGSVLGQAAGEGFSYSGPSDTRYGSGLQDGGFESTAASPWLAEPDAALVDRLGPFTPTGSGMARISTGLGSVVSSGSIEQSFCLPANATALKFDWNFLSEEFVEYVGPEFPFDDSFIIELVTRDDSVTHELFNEDIDSVYDFPGVDPTTLRFDHPVNCTPSPNVGVGTGGQDCKVWATDWQTEQLTLACCARPTRRPVTLRLKARDVGDSVFDSAVLVDEISIVAPP